MINNEACSRPKKKNASSTDRNQTRKPSFPSLQHCFRSSNFSGPVRVKNSTPAFPISPRFCSQCDGTTNTIVNTERRPKRTANRYLKNMIRCVYSQIDEYNPEYAVHLFMRPPSLLRLAELQLRHYIWPIIHKIAYTHKTILIHFSHTITTSKTTIAWKFLQS